MGIAVELEPPTAPSTPFRGLWLVVVALLLAGPLAAVLVGRSAPDTTLAAITASAASVERAKTVVITTTVQNEISGAPSFEWRSTNHFDNERGMGRFTSTSTLGSGSTLEGVFAQDRIYVRAPGARLGETAGKPWVGATIERSGEVEASTDALTGPQLIEALYDVDGEVEDLGPDVVNGVATTHYRFALDLEPGRERARKVREKLGKLAPAEPQPEVPSSASPAELWLDDQGRPRRFRLQLSVGPAGEQRLVTRMESEYEYDRPVDVAIPPEDQVHSVATFADALRLVSLYPEPPTVATTER